MNRSVVRLSRAGFAAVQRRGLAMAVPAGFRVSPAAGFLLSNNPTLSIEAIAKMASGHSPSGHSTIITKVNSHPLRIIHITSIEYLPPPFLRLTACPRSSRRMFWRRSWHPLSRLRRWRLRPPLLPHPMWHPPCRLPLRPQQVRDPVLARPRFAPGHALRPTVGLEGSFIVR